MRHCRRQRSATQKKTDRLLLLQIQMNPRRGRFLFLNNQGTLKIHHPPLNHRIPRSIVDVQWGSGIVWQALEFSNASFVATAGSRKAVAKLHKGAPRTNHFDHLLPSQRSATTSDRNSTDCVIVASNFSIARKSTFSVNSVGQPHWLHQQMERGPLTFCSTRIVSTICSKIAWAISVRFKKKKHLKICSTWNPASTMIRKFGRTNIETRRNTASLLATRGSTKKKPLVCVSMCHFQVRFLI